MSEEKTKKKKTKGPERVSIHGGLKEKLVTLTGEANKALQGVVRISKSDVINLILDGHSESLSPSEIDKLKTTHMDQVKLAFWLAQEMKAAKHSGENVSLKELLSRCEIALGRPRKPRKKMSKVKAESIVSEELRSEGVMPPIHSEP